MQYYSRLVFAIAIAAAALLLPCPAAGDDNTLLDIEYVPGGGPRRMLDIYLPPVPITKRPVLVHFHGGGWRMGDKKRTAEHGRFFSTFGIAFVSANYRLTPEVVHPEHAEDCADAVAWVFENAQSLGLDTHRIFLSGHSAGAHLAALLATDEKYLSQHGLHPNSLAGIIPVDTASFDLTDQGGRPVEQRLIGKLVRNAFGTDRHTLIDGSPMHHVKRGHRYPTFLIPVSGKRRHVIQQSRKFASRLQRAESYALVEVVRGHNHREMNQGMYALGDPVSRAILQFILKR